MIPEPWVPTQEEVAAFHRWECSLQGHSFDVVVSYGGSHPSAVICGHCGKVWHLAPEGDTDA